jgi:excisionase family DNA binding protein
MDSKYLKVPEAAKYLNTSVRFIRRLVAERRIAFHKVGAHVRFAVKDLDAFLAAGRVEAITRDTQWRNIRGAA